MADKYIYNPRDNTPIKMPEKKVCPTCGHELAPDVKPITNHMNVYVNDLSGREVVINSDEAYVAITIDGQVVRLRRSDVKVAPDSSAGSAPNSTAPSNNTASVSGSAKPVTTPKTPAPVK